MPKDFEDLLSISKMIKRNEQLDPDFYDPPPKVGVVAEPRTQAGRALADGIVLDKTARAVVRQQILAIEAEAREDLGQLFGIMAFRVGETVEFQVYRRGEPAEPPTVTQAGDTFTVTYTARVE